MNDFIAMNNIQYISLENAALTAGNSQRAGVQIGEQDQLSSNSKWDKFSQELLDLPWYSNDKS